MAKIGEIIKYIEDCTGLKAKGREIPYEVNTIVKCKFVVEKHRISVYTRIVKKKDDEEKPWTMLSVVPPKNIRGYMTGFFGAGNVTQNGKPLTKDPRRAKNYDEDASQYIEDTTFDTDIFDNEEENTMTKKPVKKSTKKATAKNSVPKRKATTKKAAPVRRERAKKNSYKLGEPQKAATVNKLIKELTADNDEPRVTAVARAAILKNFDNDAVIKVIEEAAGYEGYVDADVNKIRRALRRKGEWS